MTGSDNSRAALLDAAQHEFAARGFDAASLRNITDRAEVAHGMVRHHFGTKAGLWRAVVDRAVIRYDTALRPYATREIEDPETALATARAAGRRFLEVSGWHPDLMRLVLHESGGGERLAYLLERFKAVEAMMTPLFRQVQQAGQLRQFDQPAFFLTLLTAGAMPFALPGLAEGVLGAPLRPDTEQGRRHVERVLHTLYGPQ